jgi:phosphoribosylaminoimidazolecarboxamide formyltransferase / IMP cyclohydrolase
MFKNALISVSDKTGLVEFLKPLVANGLRVVSTGGTSKHLRENGIPVVEVAEQTGFPEVMDGRVRTLHPNIHMPLLARAYDPEDMALLKQNNLEPFDLLICNLYPFADAMNKGLKGRDLIEYIDIGGPSLLRAAAKNFERIAVVCDPQDYKWISNQELTVENRKKLAAKVYQHTSHYDG